MANEGKGFDFGNIAFGDTEVEGIDDAKKETSVIGDEQKDKAADDANKGNEPNNAEGSKETKEEDKLPEKKDSSTTGKEEETSEYSIDEQGNLVDKDNKIFRKKGEFVTKEDGSVELTDLPLIREVVDAVKAAGYEVPDDVEFPDTTEGIVKLAEHMGEQKFTTELNALYQEFPVAKQFLAHLFAGKNPAEFYQTQLAPSYRNLVVDANDTAAKKNIITDYLTKVASNDKDTADALLKYYEDGGQIDAQFTKAFDALKTKEVADESAREQANFKAIQDKEKEQLTHWNSVKAVVQKGEIGGVAIPEKERTAFYEYLSKAVDNSGVSQSAKDYEALPLDKKLMIDYLVFKKLSLNELVKIEVGKERVTELKRRVVVVKPTDNKQTIKTSTNEVNYDKLI